MERRRRTTSTTTRVARHFLLPILLSIAVSTTKLVLASSPPSSNDNVNVVNSGKNNDDDGNGGLEALVKVLLGDEDGDSLLGANPNFVEKDKETDAAESDVPKEKKKKNKKKKKKKQSQMKKKSSKTTTTEEEEEELVDEKDKKQKEKKKKKEGKSVINKALSKSRDTTSKTVKFLKKHRATLTVAAIVYAFRREILLLLSKLIGVRSDGKGRRTIRINPTNILKILIFLDVMRKIQNSTSGSGGGAAGGGDGAGESAALFALLGPGGGLLSHALSKFLEPGNPTFVPPIEQHYTFERINERYEKDRMAYKKALPRARGIGGAGAQRDKSSLSTLSSSILRSAVAPPTKERRRFGGIRAGQRSAPDMETGKNITAVHEALSKLVNSEGIGIGRSSSDEYNGTVIILDLQNLDTSVSSMSVLRDQVSFLLTHIRENEEERQILKSVLAVFDEAKKKSQNSNPEKDEEKNVTAVASETNVNKNTENTTASEVPSPGKTDLPTNEGQIEVIILLESPGGSASDYGLAASQIGRLRDEPNVSVTICVDKVAASGGYMMACMSSSGRLYAAPFAVLGSIGVIGTALNVHNVLQKWGVRPLVFRGGKDKAPVGAIGEVTREGIAKVQDMIDKTHAAFKRHVVDARPAMAPHIEKIATGDVWLGQDALDVGLIDRIVTSDEYVGERLREGARVLKLARYHKSKFPFLGSGHMSGYGAPLDFASQAVKNRWPGGKLLSDLRRVVSKVADLLEEVSETSSKGNLASMGNVFQAYGMSATGAQATSSNS